MTAKKGPEALKPFDPGTVGTEAGAQAREALAEDGDVETARILEGLGYSQSGMERRFDAFFSLHRAFEIYAANDEMDRALAVTLYPSGWYVPGRLENWLERALKLVRHGSAEEGWLLSRYGWTLSFRPQAYDCEGARQAFERALSIARDVADPALEMWTLGRRAQADYYHLRWQSSLENSLEAIGLSNRANDLEAEVNAHHWAAMALAMLGDFGRTAWHGAACLAAAEKSRHRFRLHQAWSSNCCIAVLKGDWNAARDLNARYANLALNEQMALAPRALVALETGEASASEFLERLASTQFPVWYWAQCPGAVQIPTGLVRHTGRADLITFRFPPVTEDTGTRRDPPIHHLLYKVALALIAVANQDREAAAEMYAVFEKERSMAAQGLMPGSLDRVFGLLATVVGSYDDATAHFEHALAFCRKGGYRPELAWVCYEHADTLLSRNGPGDAQDAAELVDEGLSIANELDMKPLAGRLQELREKSAFMRRGRPKYPDGLTAREVEVLRLVSTGMSNQEIANKLVISPNTVIRHVSNIFNKIGASNRAEAAAYAIRHNMV